MHYIDKSEVAPDEFDTARFMNEWNGKNHAWNAWLFLIEDMSSLLLLVIVNRAGGTFGGHSRYMVC